MLGPVCILVERSLGAHRPLTRRTAEAIQGLLLPDDREPDWLFEQCGRIARALDEGQVALAQIYGLYIPIEELDDRRLAKLARATSSTRTGFNPDEPRIPKGNPHGGEWTNGGDGEASSGSSSNAASDLGGNGSESDEGGSGSTASPTSSDLGAGASDSGGDGGGDGTGSGSGGIPMPAPPADASDVLSPSPSGAPSTANSAGGPAIEYIIVEPQNTTPASGASPATGTAVPAAGAPTPLGSADLDYPVPAAIPPTTHPNSGGADGNEGAPGSSAASSETPPVDDQRPGPPPEFPSEKPPTTRQVNAIFRSTAIWLARGIRLLGDLDPEVRAVWAALDTIEWLVKCTPKIVSYLDPPRTLYELEDAVGDARAGYEIHHVVEAQQWSENPESNWTGFRDRINSRENLVRVPYWKHVEISSWYSRKRKELGNIALRDFLRGKPWDLQYKIGLDVLKKFGVLK